MPAPRALSTSLVQNGLPSIYTIVAWSTQTWAPTRTTSATHQDGSRHQCIESPAQAGSDYTNAVSRHASGRSNPTHAVPSRVATIIMQRFAEIVHDMLCLFSLLRIFRSFHHNVGPLFHMQHILNMYPGCYEQFKRQNRHVCRTTHMWCSGSSGSMRNVC